MKTVAIVELNLLERMVPLLGGYLEAYAMKDPWLKENVRFTKYADSPRLGRDKLLRQILGLEADVYAFSCYVWNSGLVRSLLADLRRLRPSASIILGGPQVMHGAEKYLARDNEAVAICNGEGELTFSHYLRELTQIRPDLSKVPGISYVVDGEIVTTPACARTTSLDDIPSPFLTNLFTGEYSLSVLETNRGCPFRCGFCYWGAATNDRVYKFSEDRVRDEITWLSKKGILYLYVADANWGMLKRDVDLTRHLAECSRREGAPRQVYFSAAKNSPERVFEIAKICQSASMIVAQPVSLQTMSDEALRMIDRQNIKKASYIKLQSQLEELMIKSVTELIWPLPGETLASFKAGLEELCRTGESMLVAYPHVLLANTPLEKRRREFGLDTIMTLDGVGESELVVGTSTVSRSDFEEGFRFFYALHLLHNAHGLRGVTEYLDRTGIASRQSVFTAFAAFAHSLEDNPIVDYITESCRGQIGVETFPFGRVAHYALHEYRSQFTDMIHRFIATQPYWMDERVRVLYELDQIRLPYVYATTPLSTAGRFELLASVSCRDRSYEIAVPDRFLDLVQAGGAPVVNGGGTPVGRYRIDHARGQFPMMKSQSIDYHSGYCQEVIRTGSAVAQCTPVH